MKNRQISVLNLAVLIPTNVLGLLNLFCGSDNFSKIWSACGQDEIQYTEKEMNKCTYNNISNFTFVFSYTSYAIKLQW
jgi:hypothetical protein